MIDCFFFTKYLALIPGNDNLLLFSLYNVILKIKMTSYTILNNFQMNIKLIWFDIKTRFVFLFPVQTPPFNTEYRSLYSEVSVLLSKWPAFYSKLRVWVLICECRPAPSCPDRRFNYPSFRLSIYKTVLPSVCMSILLSLCLSVFLSVCPSVCLSARLSGCLSVPLSDRLSICWSVVGNAAGAKRVTQK